MRKITWYFWETGYVKSSAGEVSSLVKKSADLAVSHGKDILYIKNFVEVVEEANPDFKLKLFKMDDKFDLNKNSAVIVKIMNLVRSIILRIHLTRAMRQGTLT